MKHILPIIFLLSLSSNISPQTNDSLFTVPLRRFSDKIYSEIKSKYKLKIKGHYKMPDTLFQKVLSSGSSGDYSYTTIISGDLDNCKKQSPESLNNYLENTRLLNLDDREILNLKQRFSGSEDPLNDIENFVYDYIKSKTIGIPIISASEILKSRAGDCTEHTVLAVSIMRSLGIPSRALTGMLLSREFQGRKNVFVYHMWAEAFIDNKWILVDAANPGKKYANRYIAFSYHHLKTEMPLAYLKAVSAIKALSVEYTGLTP